MGGSAQAGLVGRGRGGGRGSGPADQVGGNEASEPTAMSVEAAGRKAVGRGRRVVNGSGARLGVGWSPSGLVSRLGSGVAGDGGAVCWCWWSCLVPWRELGVPVARASARRARPCSRAAERARPPAPGPAPTHARSSWVPSRGAVSRPAGLLEQRSMTDEAQRSPDDPFGGHSRGGVTSELRLRRRPTARQGPRPSYPPTSARGARCSPARPSTGPSRAVSCSHPESVRGCESRRRSSAAG